MAHNSLDTPTLPPAWLEGVMHSAYVRIVIAYVERMGLVANMRSPTTERMLSFVEFLPVLDALDVQRNPQIGVVLGASAPAAAHGAMGYAAVSSETVGQALEAIARFIPMRNRLFDLRVTTERAAKVLTVTPRIPLGGYNAFLEIATVVTVFKMVQSLVGDAAAEKMEFDATWPSGGKLDVPMKLRYSRPVSALRVPMEIASLRPITADARLYDSACRSCEEELAILSGSISARVRGLIPNAKGDWPGLIDVAQELAMSRSTLIRRLADEGVAFQDLVDEVRRELACWYLRKTSLALSGIAERLGYVDTSNFSRSFRRWQGVTPLEYRSGPV